MKSELRSLIMERDTEIVALKGEISSLDAILLNETPEVDVPESPKKSVTFDDNQSLSNSEQVIFLCLNIPYSL